MIYYCKCTLCDYKEDFCDSLQVAYEFSIQHESVHHKSKPVANFGKKRVRREDWIRLRDIKIRRKIMQKEVIHRTDPDEIAAYIAEGWKIEGSVSNGIVNYSPTVYLSRSADAVVVLPDLLPCKICFEKPTEGKIHDLPTVECCNEALGYTQRLARQNWNEQFGKIL